MLSDSDLIKECLKDSIKAKEELYKRFEKNMFGVCMRYAKNRMQAEDFLHEGFIKVLDRLNDYRHEGSLGGWIRRIMVNTALNYFRDNMSFNQCADIEVAETQADFDKDAVSQLSAKELLGFVSDLPEGYRMVFNLYVIEGYTHKEIGEMLNISDNTSKSQLAMARKSLQTRIKQECYEKTI